MPHSIILLYPTTLKEIISIDDSIQSRTVLLQCTQATGDWLYWFIVIKLKKNKRNKQRVQEQTKLIV